MDTDKHSLTYDGHALAWRTPLSGVPRSRSKMRDVVARGSGTSGTEAAQLRVWRTLAWRW